MQPDKQKLLVAYADEDSDLLIFDVSATHKGVESSFKVPGEVVSVSYTAGNTCLLHRQLRTHGKHAHSGKQ